MAKGKRKQLRKRALRESNAVVSPPDGPESNREESTIEEAPVDTEVETESPNEELEESEDDDDAAKEQRLFGPDCDVEDSIRGGCTIIPYNISIEEWASGAVHLPQVNFDISGIKLSSEIYQRAATVTEECKKSEALQPYFCGGEFDNVFMVEFGNYVCLSPITSTFRIQANQLLNLITDTGRNPYGNSIILEIRRTSGGYKYHNVSRKRALRFLSGKLAEMTKSCLERNPLLRNRYWLYDPECEEGVKLFGNDKEVDELGKWGYDTKLMAFHYKTHKCHRVRTHLKQTCPFYHSLLDARRPLSMFKYSSKRCNAGAEDCLHGVHCNLSHNEYEHFYHPDFLRHSECMHWKQNGNCKGPLCSFFHEGEMSPPVGKKEPPAIALPASLSGIGPPGGLARSATRVPRYGLNAPLTQSFSPSTRLRTSFSQEGIIFSLKDSQSAGKKQLSSSGEVRPPGVKSSVGGSLSGASIKDSTLQCRYDYPQSELRDSEGSQNEPAPISIAYQYQLKCQEVLVSYALCVLQKIFGPEDWLAQVTGFLLNSKTDISLLDPSLWDLNLIRDIILHLKQDGTLVFGEPYAITNAVLEFFSAPLPANDEEQFHFWCFLVQVLKMEAIHQDFLPVQALVHQFEEFVENQDDSDVKVPTEHSLEYWQLFQRYMWQPSSKESTSHVLIMVGALPPFDHTAGVLYLSHVEWDLVLDFGLSSNTVLKDILILQNSDDRPIHDGYINDCDPSTLDPPRMLSWFNMRPTNSDLLPEDYSRTVIGGRQDIVLQRYVQVLRAKRLHCTVMAYDVELTNNPLLNSHLNHVLNTLNRLPDCRVTFTTFTDHPAKVRSLLYEPKMRRSIESISFAQVCNGFQTVVDTDRLPISLPSAKEEISVASLYRTICPYFQLLFLERRRFHIETTRTAKLNWAKGGPLPWQLLERDDRFFPLQQKAFQECLNKLNQAIDDAKQSDAPIEVQINFAHSFEANTFGRQLLWDVHERVPALINLFTEDISPTDVEKVSKMLKRLHRATEQVIVCMIDPTICNPSRVAGILRPLSIPLVILHVGVAVPPVASARRFAVSSHLSAEESQRLVAYLSEIVEENDPDSSYTLAKIRQRLDKLQQFSLHPSLFLYTTLFRLQKSANVESFVFSRLDAAQWAPHHLMWLMCIAFTSRFADEALEIKYLLQASQQPLSEFENWVESELIKELIVMDHERENVMTLNITVANEIIKWICANEEISVADMTVRFIDSVVPHDLESTAPLSEIIFKLFYRIDHEDSFTELISCLSKEDTATILTYIKAILPTTYSACGLARFLWTRGEQTEENTTKINELMEEAFTLCTNPYEQYYYYLSHGIMFATMFKYYVACSNSGNWRRILPVANNLHKRACSNFFKARGRLYGRLSYSTDYLIFPYILELTVRAAFLNYFLQAIMESMGPVKTNFQVTNYYLVSSEKPSSLEDSRSICIELLHKLELFVQFQKDPVLLTAYKVERDQSLIRTSLDRVESIKAALSPLLGDGQAQFIALSDLCSTENRLSYEIRRMSIWNLIEQYRKNKMASWFNADEYIHQALEFINHNVQPSDTGSSFRDFDMVSWILLLRMAHSDESLSSILPTLTSWCLKTTKLTNNHPIIANYYRYICLFLVWVENPTDPTQKEAFMKSLKTCQNLVEAHSYPSTVAEFCHEFVGSSNALNDLCPLDQLKEKKKGEILSLEGQLVPQEDKPVAEWTVTFHDFAFPLSTIHTWAEGSKKVESSQKEPIAVRFSVMFSWASPKAFHVTPL